MKKSLIALAALSAFATAAQAQSSVTVYGIIDAGYNSLETTANNGAKTTVTNASRTNGEAATSRLGFRGTEDLGGGLKANFAMESGIAADSTLTFGGRAFWVGLEDSKMGQIRVGRQDSFARTLWLGADQLAAANVVGNVAYDNGTPMADSETTSHTTRHNGVNYLSPNMNGLQLSVGVMKAETETAAATQKTGSGSQFGLSYAVGKFTAAAAYAEASTGASSAAYVKTKDTAAALTYDFGVTKVGYIYNKRESTDAAGAGTNNNTDRTSHAFSASVPLSAKLTGRLGYGFGEYRQGAASAFNGDFKGYQAALNYNLSKRTMVYGIYGESQRDLVSSTEVKAKEYSVGVRHSF